MNLMFGWELCEILQGKHTILQQRMQTRTNRIWWGEGKELEYVKQIYEKIRLQQEFYPNQDLTDWHCCSSLTIDQLVYILTIFNYLFGGKENEGIPHVDHEFVSFWSVKMWRGWLVGLRSGRDIKFWVFLFWFFFLTPFFWGWIGVYKSDLLGRKRIWGVV